MSVQDSASGNSIMSLKNFLDYNYLTGFIIDVWKKAEMQIVSIKRMMSGPYLVI